MDFGQIISRAAQITWRYKFLWIFGFVMTLCGQANGGSLRIQINYPYSMPFYPRAKTTEFPAYLPEPLGQTPVTVYIIATIVLVIVFGVISSVVGAIGRAAIIQSVHRIENDKLMNFGSSWQDGLNKAVSLGVLHALLYIPLLIFWTAIVLIPFIQFWPFYSRVLLGVANRNRQLPHLMNDFPLMSSNFVITIIYVGICFAFFIQIIMAFLLTFCSRAILLENKTIIGSFDRSWYLFRQNVWSIIVLALLILVTTIAANCAVAIPAMVTMILLVSSTPSMFLVNDLHIIDYLLMGGSSIIITGLFCAGGGVAQVFTEALWTLAYREFMEQSTAS